MEYSPNNSIESVEWFTLPQVNSRTPTQIQLKKFVKTSSIDLALLTAALDNLAEGIAIANSGGLLLFANTQARRFLGIQSQEAVETTALSSANSENINLKAALERAAFGGEQTLIEVANTSEPTFLRISPLQNSQRGLVLILFGTPMSATLANLKSFAALYHLTSAELSVLEKVAQGLNPAQICKLHQVATSTINTQMASIRAKTRTTNARELMAKISKIPAIQSIDSHEISISIRG